MVVMGLCLEAGFEERMERCDAATIVPGGRSKLLRLLPSFLGIWEEAEGAGSLVGDLSSESAMLCRSGFEDRAV